MKHGDAKIYKTSPVVWIRYCSNQYSPTCNSKYIQLYQGGELFNNPDANKILQPFGYTLHPTVADTCHKNGPVARYHRTLANYIQAILTGDNLDINFLPYALYHAIQLSNSFPEPNTITSPIEKAKSNQENLSLPRTFGCRVYVQLPGKIKPKLKNRISELIFLGYDPHTTQMFLYYDVGNHIIKLASCVQFDEGMN